MLSSIFCDPVEYITFIDDLDDEEIATGMGSSGKSEVSLSLKDLTDSIHCGAISTVTMSKHVVEETGREVWTVDKVCFGSKTVSNAAETLSMHLTSTVATNPALRLAFGLRLLLARAHTR